jgi:hypothetical protein
MYLLDTDHLSIYDQDTIEAFNIGRRREHGTGAKRA